MPQVTFTPFFEAGVSFLPADQEASSPFLRPLQDDPGTTRILPFSGVVSNSTDKRIVALTVIWTLQDSSGEEKTSTLNSDSLLFATTPVVNAGGRTLVGPGLILPDSAPQSGFVGSGGGSTEREAARFEQSSRVRVDLDVLVFEDGLVAGPDKSETVAQLQGRKQAADSLGRYVLESLGRGEDPRAGLSEIANLPINRQDPANFWRPRLARTLLQSGNLRAQAERFLKLPTVAFHRH